MPLSVYHCHTLYGKDNTTSNEPLDTRQYKYIDYIHIHFSTQMIWVVKDEKYIIYTVNENKEPQSSVAI